MNCIFSNETLSKKKNSSDLTTSVLNDPSSINSNLTFPIIKWTSEFSYPESKTYLFEHTSISNCTKEEETYIKKKYTPFNESLQVIGGLNYLLPALNISFTNQNLIFLFKILQKIFLQFDDYKQSINKEFFDILKLLLEKKIEKPNKELAAEVINFISSVNNETFYPIIIENILFNKHWIDLDEEYLLKLFCVLIDHRIKYHDVINTSVSLPIICKFFSHFMKLTNNDQKISLITSHYFFFLLKLLVEKHKKLSDPEIYLMIIKNSAESSIIKGNMQHFTELLEKIFANQKNLTGQHDFMSALVSILGNMIKNKNDLDSILLKFIFKLFIESFQLCNADKARFRVIDFKSDFSQEAIFIEKTYREIEKSMGFILRFNICKEIIEFVEIGKYRHVIAYAEINKIKDIPSFINEQKPFKNSKDLINIITNSLFTTFEDNITNFKQIANILIEKCNTSKSFPKIIIKQENFPLWTYNFFLHTDNINTLVIINFVEELFSNMALFENFNKLRSLLFDLIKSGNPNVLDIFYGILTNKTSIANYKESFKYFIEIVNVAEDLTQYNAYIFENCRAFNKIVMTIYELSKSAEFSLNFPKGKGFQFYETLNLDNPYEYDNNTIYFRDGGLCRQLFKLIFISLEMNPNPYLEQQIYQIFKKNNTKHQEKEWKLLEKAKNVKRLSFLPLKTQKNYKKLIFIYVFIEWLRIIKGYSNINPNSWLEIKMFYKQFELEKKLKNLNCKDYLMPNILTWKKIQEIIEKQNPNIKDKYKNINTIINENKHLFISNQLTNIDKDFEHLPEELEIFLLVHTSLKMDILSNRYIYKDDKINELTILTILGSNIKERTQSEISCLQKEEIDIKAIISEKKLDKLIKSIRLPENDLSKGLFYARPNFENYGHKSIMQMKQKISTQTTTKNISFPYKDSFLSTPELQLNEPSISYLDSTEVSIATYAEPDSPVLPEESTILNGNNSKKIELPAEMIFIKGFSPGIFIIEDAFILFKSKPDKFILPENDNEEEKDHRNYSSSLPETIIENEIIKFWDIGEIKEIIKRRFIHVYSAIEIFLHSGKSYFINFHTKENCNIAINRLKAYEINNNKHILLENDIEKYVKLWKSGKISNFEYLMMLNKYSGRSFNDLSQYPIFPWIVTDYQSKELDFSCKESFRNLELPVCGQTEEGRKMAEKMYKMSIKDESSPYNYGSHYSNGGIVLHYLMRLEPYSTQSKKLQGGNFDISDRLFISIEDSWKGSQKYHCDCKELIPEMFFLPELLTNINEYKFSKRQNGEEVQGVALPVWAANSEFNFIRLHRRALESRYISQNVHQWIDLIFGYKQQGHKAKESYNLFYPLTYEQNYLQIMEDTHPMSQVAMIHQAIHFGQTPIKLFKAPHLKKDEISSKIQIFERIMKKADYNLEEICKSDKLIIAILNNSKYLLLIKKTIFIKVIKYKLKIESVLESAFVDEIELNGLPFNTRNELIIVLFKEDIVTGGYENSCIYINNLFGDLINVLKYHSAPINCLVGGNLLVSGSKDSTIVSFNLKENILYHGHMSEITNLSIIEELCIIVSSSFQLILIHDHKSGRIINKFDIDCICFQANFNGIIVIETKEKYLVKYINGQTMHQIDRKEASTYCLIGEIVMIYQQDSLFCIDIYDKKRKDIVLDKPIDIRKIVYDSKKDVIFFLENNQQYIVQVFNVRLKI